MNASAPKPPIQCLLWDFGDTLCDERFIWSSAPSGWPSTRPSTTATSWEERTLDKGRLGTIALERVGLEIDPSEALLIDHRPDYLAHWTHRGGSTYHHCGDGDFAADVARGRLP